MTIPSVTAGGWWLVADLSGYDVHTAGWAQARTQPGYRDTGKLGAHTLYISTYLPHSAYLLSTHRIVTQHPSSLFLLHLIFANLSGSKLLAAVRLQSSCSHCVCISPLDAPDYFVSVVE